MGDVSEHIGKDYVLAAEDIALPDATALQSGEVAGGHVIDMNEIKTAIYEARHAPAGGFDDDASGRRRPDVARADRRRGIDDDRRKPVTSHHRLHQSLGGDLAALVGADRRPLRQ